MPKMTTKQRRKKLEECGKQCFGDCCGPKARKAGHPRYPLCGRGCDPTCANVLKAYRRAAQQHERKIKMAMKRLGQRMGCTWAK